MYLLLNVSFLLIISLILGLPGSHGCRKNSLFLHGEEGKIEEGSKTHFSHDLKKDISSLCYYASLALNKEEFHQTHI